MFKRQCILFIIALVAIMLISVIATVSSQSSVATQQWEYGILIWDASGDEFTWHVSAIYDATELELAMEHEPTESMLDSLADSEDAGIADYLAVMGISGYELVDVTNLQASNLQAGGALVYTFKRPLKE